MQHELKPAILITNKVTLMYDMAQEVEGAVEANCLGIVLLHKKDRKALLIFFTVPIDINIIKVTTDKYKKYRNCHQEQYDLKKVHMIPIIVGALGTVCKNLERSLAWVSPQDNLDIIQKEVLLGFSHIF
eukprot:13850795-Ditylum_brightwellii.AAC.1